MAYLRAVSVLQKRVGQFLVLLEVESWIGNREGFYVTYRAGSLKHKYFIVRVEARMCIFRVTNCMRLSHAVSLHVTVLFQVAAPSDGGGKVPFPWTSTVAQTTTI